MHEREGMQMKKVDGVEYRDDETVHDLGSFELVSVEDGNVRGYSGFSYDIDKLPTYPNLGAFSFAQCQDTGETYFYHKKTRTWNKSQ